MAHQHASGCLPGRGTHLLHSLWRHGLLRQGTQIRDGDHGQPRRKGQTLRDTGCQTHARERTGTAAEGDGIELAQSDARLGEQCIDQGQHMSAVATFRQRLARTHLAIEVNGDAAPLARRIERQQFHAGARARAQRCSIAIASLASRVGRMGGRLASSERP